MADNTYERGFDYKAPPTVATFMQSDAFGRLLAGPVGSGKTTGIVIELLRRATQQLPASDGNRYTRFAVVRQTLKQLKDTVLKDCQNWLDPIGGLWKVSDNTYYLNVADIRSEWIFIPLEDQQDQARLLSMQLTGAWLSECIEMDLSVVAPISGRLGRYPAGKRGVPTWHGMVADTNMPPLMSPWHTFMENLPPTWEKFIQPGGMSAGAENLNWLTQTPHTITLPLDHPQRLAQGRRYYENFVVTEGPDSDWVKRYVNAEYGDDPSSEAVFKNTFKSDFHIVEDTTVVQGYPLIVAQDFGRNPWSLICQPDHMGRLLVHKEVPANNIGLEKHVEQHLKPALWTNKFFGNRFCVVGDPAGVAKDSIGEESCFDALKRLGLPAYPAPTNDIEPRLRAVEALLGRQTNGGPTIVISRTGCPWLCRAMSGGYRFTRTKQGGLRPIPEKNDREGFSHVADCLQYASLIVHGGMMPYVTRMLRPPGKKRIGPSSAGWT